MTKVSKPADLSRELRRALGDLTQAELAVRLLVSRNYISQIEAELKTPSPRLLEQMRRLLTESANADKEGIHAPPVRTHDSAAVAATLEKLRAAEAAGPQSIFSGYDARHLEVLIQAVVDLRLRKAAGRREQLANLLEDLLKGEPAVLSEESALPPRGTLIAMLTMLSRDPETFEKLAVQATAKVDSSQNPAVIEAKNRGRQRGFKRAAEILEEEAAAARESGSAPAKSG